MTPFQVPKIFKFKPLYPLLFQDGTKPFSSPPLSYNNPPIILFDTFVENLCKQILKKKGSFMEAFENFKMHGSFTYLVLNLFLMI
jgi:hypothetical protein